jgi:hypothetical protein
MEELRERVVAARQRLERPAIAREEPAGENGQP